MSHFPRSLRLAAGIAVMATAAVSLAACSSDETAADSEAASATSLADFGSFEDLEAAAKEEGALNVIALPRDWANYGAILDLFAERYPEITINEASPDVSSAEEIQAAETNAGTDKAPDVFDLGLTVALQNVDAFAPYQVEGFDDIPESLKDPEGRFVGDYGGYMSVGVDTSKYPAPTELADLTGGNYKGAVAINGDPTQAGAAFAAVGLASILSDGSSRSTSPRRPSPRARPPSSSTGTT
jgi:putative spermidine/putrescine transport system substrate-binding protein